MFDGPRSAETKFYSISSSNVTCSSIIPGGQQERFRKKPVREKVFMSLKY